jgi:precorrin-2 dehydrogenase/sirohydrochlorin ferrochelatase
MAEPRFAYPIVLSLAGRRAVVVGGGRVAARKARDLADAGADVTVVAPALADEIRSDPRLACTPEPYAAHHVAGAAVVVAATDDEAVNARVAADARAAGALVNVVDRPALCDFIVPSQVVRGPLVVAITTGGAAPSLSRRLRERLEKEFGPEYGPYLEILREVRERMKASDLPIETRRRVAERLTEPDILEAARLGDDALRRAVDAAVASVIGRT